MIMKYIGNTVKTKDTSCLVESIHNNAGKLHQTLRQVTDNSVSVNTLTTAYKECEALKQAISNLCNAKEESGTYDIKDSVVDMEIQKESNIYHFVLNSRLPVSSKIERNGELNKLAYNKSSELFSSFYKGILNYIHDNPIEMQKRVVVLFINYYTNDEFWSDVDNVNYKPFIDACIKNVFVNDDNAKHVSMICTAKEGLPHTEVFVARDVTDLIEHML